MGSLHLNYNRTLVGDHYARQLLAELDSDVWLEEAWLLYLEQGKSLKKRLNSFAKKKASAKAKAGGDGDGHAAELPSYDEP